MGDKNEVPVVRPLDAKPLGKVARGILDAAAVLNAGPVSKAKTVCDYPRSGLNPNREVRPGSFGTAQDPVNKYNKQFLTVPCLGRIDREKTAKPVRFPGLRHSNIVRLGARADRILRKHRTIQERRF